jgi:N utilization substance protein B
VSDPRDGNGRLAGIPAHLLPVPTEPDDRIELESVEGDDDDGPRPGSRTEARETALVLLYEAESRVVSPAVVLDAQVLPPPPFAAALVLGVAEHRDEIDALIGRFARNWRLERMPALDRCVLRMAVYELVHRPDVPKGVVLSEAVELASRYSTEASGRFVNGVLAAVANEVRDDGARG